tara:strand:+ start:144 stop:914 length:771 start_codon:yes stop_codon:yes gene_type:complete
MVNMTLDQVVREYLIEHALPDHKYFQALQLGISCIRELNFDVTGSPVVVNLPVNEDDTVDLPDDYINYIRIGFCDKYGDFKELGKNKSICLNRTLDDCGAITTPTVDPNATSGTYLGVRGSSEYYATHFRNGEATGRFYGLGGGNNVNGGFKIDTVYSQIQLDCYGGGDTITLEYLSNPEKSKGNFIVIPFAIETVKNWIGWRLNLNNPNVPAVSTQMRERLYIKSNKILRARMKKNTVQDILQSFRKANKAAPKF